MSLNVSERGAIVEQAVTSALDVYADPYVQRRVDAKALVKFTSMLERAFMPNVSDDGMLSVPREYADIPEAVPLIPIEPGEVLRFKADLAHQTPRQHEQSIAQTERWKVNKLTPEATAESIGNMLVTRAEARPYEAAYHPAAMVVSGLRAAILDPTAMDKPPAGDLLLIRGRPLVVLGVDGAGHGIEPDLLTHELVHVEQLTRKPLVAYSSQRSVQLEHVKNELEAYHHGAQVRVGLLDKRDVEDPAHAKDIVPGLAGLQLGVEHLRVALRGAHSDHPFAPVPDLMKNLDKQFGLDMLLHGSLDYDAVKASLTA